MRESSAKPNQTKINKTKTKLKPNQIQPNQTKLDLEDILCLKVLRNSYTDPYLFSVLKFN